MSQVPPPKRGAFYTLAELEEILTQSDSEDEFIAGNEQDESADEFDEIEAQVQEQLRTSPVDQHHDSEEINQPVDIHENIRWEEGNIVPQVFPFDCGNSGHNIPDLFENCSEYDCFQVFLGEQITSFIVSETNKFYKYVVEHKELIRPHSRLKQWTDTDLQEIYRFFALNFLMARVKKLQIQEYWSTNPLIETPAFGKTMSRDRFLGIMSMLHFSDNNLPRDDDTLRKIRNIVDHARVTFKESFTPYKELCIDESLMLYKGRLFFKQYIPSKRHRFGIKFFVLCDAVTGYILDFIVYTGATTETVQSNFGKSGDVVLTLLEPYLDKGHTLFLDNWYSSPDLFLWLYNRCTNACGTVRKTRKQMPKMEEKLKKGEFTFRTAKNRLIAIKWCDKREVFMLSTTHDKNVAATGKTDRTTNRQIMKPECIIEYNKRMGAVDKTDMLRSCVECVRRSTKWYKKVFFHVMDMILLNSHILFQDATKKKITLAKFQLNLISQMIDSNPGDFVYTARRAHHAAPFRLTARHFPKKIPSKNQKNLTGRKRCYVCSQKKLRKETVYMCEPCDVGLCVTPCFEKYHVLRNLH